MSNNDGNKLVAAGRDFTGSGVLAAFSGHGAGSTTRPILKKALEAEGMEDLAPKGKGPVGLAGRICRDVARTHKAKADRAPSAVRDEDGKRDYQARWVITPKNELSEVEVGDSIGSAECIVELDDEDNLTFRGSEVIGNVIQKRFNEEAHLLRNSDVTNWINDLLMGTFGAAKTVWGRYVPPGNVQRVNRLFDAVRSVFGEEHAPEPLPAATTAQLLDGIASGFMKEVKSVRTSYEKQGKDIKPADAARHLRTLEDVANRSGAYRILCGDERIDAAMVEIATLREILEPLSDATTQRFAALELDDRPSNEVAAEKAAQEPKRLSPAEKAAERIAAEKRGEVAETAFVVPAVPPLLPKEPEGPIRELELD